MDVKSFKTKKTWPIYKKLENINPRQPEVFGVEFSLREIN